LSLETLQFQLSVDWEKNGKMLDFMKIVLLIFLVNFVSGQDVNLEEICTDIADDIIIG
jgi:hypothetical protein